MRLNELKPPAGSRKDRKRVGRGSGSGHGKTSGRGNKGQKSRSGGTQKVGYEGGQMPLQRRVPKRGFTNIFKQTFALINLRDLVRFESGSVVDPAGLADAGLIKKAGDRVKLLGKGQVDRPLTLKVHGVSVAAREAVEAAGGQVELIGS
jgi:large subunit ribosomal protein L15